MTGTNAVMAAMRDPVSVTAAFGGIRDTAVVRAIRRVMMSVQSRRAEWMANNSLSEKEWTMDEKFMSMFRPGAAEETIAGTASAAARTSDREGKSTNDARNMMSFLPDKDGIPRMRADRTDLQKRLDMVQHLLRILSQTRLDDFLGVTDLNLDV